MRSAFSGFCACLSDVAFLGLTWEGGRAWGSRAGMKSRVDVAGELGAHRAKVWVSWWDWEVPAVLAAIPSHPAWGLRELGTPQEVVQEQNPHPFRASPFLSLL